MNTDNIYSLLGSVIIHLIILLILGFTVMNTILPDEDEGVLVNFGNIDAAAGTFEPQYTGGIPPRQTLPQAQSGGDDLETQDIEESAYIEDSRRRREQQAGEDNQRALDERRRQDEQRRQRENTINDRVAGAFGSSSSEEAGSQGDAATGTGNQGNPFGNAAAGANSGMGGYGSFNLNGRSVASGGLPRPDYNIQEEGRIVINITVDPRGAVIFAEIGRGTNIDNESLRQSALDAARKARFNSITGTNNQSGNITYNYMLTQ
ncbi:MAG: energy transducer TonB [Tannerellaceae bacterium]|nr:energy transducer TonB [Tannerellaceae bacterium]